MMRKFALIQVDQLCRREHHYLAETDICFYWRTYTKGSYRDSEDNSLISNLKKDPNALNTLRWKNNAINQIAGEMTSILEVYDLSRTLFVPVPPSKPTDHPEYDDRLSRILQSVNLKLPRGLKFCEAVRQTQETAPAHRSDTKRLTPVQQRALYEMTLRHLPPDIIEIVVFDDVITTGSHYKAMQLLLREQFPDININGLFIARRACPPPPPLTNLF